MKIRAIRLHNVRKFQGRSAAIEGIGDGITTICAPNESGKSTFFDALHAIFFHAHSGQAQEIRSLQPYSKGPVEICVVVEDDEGRRWRIEKRFLASKAARIVDDATGRIHAQADEAEAWIKSLLENGMAEPAGLLWVRQGMTSFGPEGSGPREKGERERLKGARQGLMSSVAGQIDNVTGGRRMDEIMRRCDADIEKIATRTGQPKAGGEWHRALKMADELTVEEQRLSAQVTELSEALEETARLRKRLEAEDDPEDLRRRRAEIEKAEADLSAALAHLSRIEAATRDLRLAALEVKEPQDRLDADARQRKARMRLVQREDLAAANLAAARTDIESVRLRHRSAAAHLAAIHQAQKARRKQLDTTIETRRVAQRRAEIDRILHRGREVKAALQDAQDRRRGNRATPEVLARAEALERTIATSQAAAAASAASLSFDYDGRARAQIDGQGVEQGTAIPVLEAMDIDLPGIGRLAVQPGKIDTGSLLETRSDLAEILDAANAADMASLRTAARDLQAAISAEDAARTTLQTLAPEGMDHLEHELAGLPEITEDFSRG